MIKPIPENVYDAIGSIFYQPYDIHRPKISGSQDNVFLMGRSPENTFVFKFSDPDLVQKNETVSKLYRSCGINVPQITAYEYNGQWFEFYKMIPGKTLYERVGNGIDAATIKSAYRDITTELAKMSCIDVGCLSRVNSKYIYQSARKNINNANNAAYATVFSTAIRALNYGPAKDMGVYHCCLTPKNIIMSGQDNMRGIIDIDEVGISNINYAFAMMAAKYQQLGHDKDELIDIYERNSYKKLNRKYINAICGITNIGKRILWKQAHKQK